MKLKRFIAACVIALSVLPLGGCWSNIEIYELAFIMGVGIDKGAGDHDYIVTAQITKPAKFNPSGESGGGDDEAYINIMAEATGLTLPIEKLKLQTDRKLYSGHNQVIIMSMDVAKTDIVPLMDCLIRSADGRLTVSLFIADGSAKDMMEVKGELEQIPVIYLKKLVGSQVQHGEMPQSTVINFLTDLLSKTSSPTIPIIRAVDGGGEEKRAELHGMAAFKDGAVCMLLDPEQTKAVFTVKGKAEESSFKIDIFDSFMTLQTIKSDVKIKPVFNNEELEKMTVTIDIACSIADTAVKEDLLSQDVRDQIASQAKIEVTQVLEDTFKYTQEYSADVFGFGDILYRYYYKTAKELVDNWDEEYPNLDVEFDVNFEILSTGSIIHPLVADSLTDDNALQKER